MPSEPTAGKPTEAHPARTLSGALAESEAIQALMNQAASDLSRVMRVIKEAMMNSHAMQMLEAALHRIAVVNTNVRLAGSKLMAVHVKLETEARYREMLEHQFAAAVEQHEGTQHAALHDVLTGLPNRALFRDRLQIAIARAKRDGCTLAVMFLDLDDFKRINDSYGHTIGDRLLQVIAGRLTEHTRGDDTVCRYGGDEFLYLANKAGDRRTIQALAQKLIGQIQAPFDAGTPEEVFAGTTASIGVATYPKDGCTPDLLIRGADAAMYHAKRNKGGVAFMS